VARQGRRVPARPGGGPHPAVISRNKADAAGAPTYPSTATLTEGSGTRTFASLTTAAGDWIVVSVVGENGDATALVNITPSHGSLTFTRQVDAGGTGDVRAQIWTAHEDPVTGGGSRVITMTPSPSATHSYHAVATVVRNSTGPGSTGTSITGQTVSVVRSKDNSGLFMAVGDFTTGPVGSPTWIPGGSTIASQAGVQATYIHGRFDYAGAAGTSSSGISSPTYTTPSVAVLEMWGTPAVVGSEPLVVTPPFVPVPIPGAKISSSQPLGNPAVPTRGPLVVTPTFTPAPISGALLFGPGAPAAVVSATATPQPLVVSPGFTPAPLIPAQVFFPTAVATTPNVSVVTPPYQPVPTPSVSITSSRPLGNPATSSPDPLVVSTPWTSKVPGALLFGPGAPTAPVVTGSTPGPLVVGPPNLPVPIPVTYLSASQPLGNPAVGTPEPLVVGPPFTPVPVPGARISGNPAAPVVSTVATPQPLVVSTFTLAPVPGAKVFSAPAAPLVAATPTPGPLVVGPPWQPVPIPKTYLTASYPLGRPAVASPQPLVVGPPHRWTQLTPAHLSGLVSVTYSCSTLRPSTGITAQPNTGTTAYALATTARPNTGTTARPNTGTTEDPC
jgi:hypothetical protein